MVTEKVIFSCTCRRRIIEQSLQWVRLSNLSHYHWSSSRIRYFREKFSAACTSCSKISKFLYYTTSAVAKKLATFWAVVIANVSILCQCLCHSKPGSLTVNCLVWQIMHLTYQLTPLSCIPPSVTFSLRCLNSSVRHFYMVFTLRNASAPQVCFQTLQSFSTLGTCCCNACLTDSNCSLSL